MVINKKKSFSGILPNFNQILYNTYFKFLNIFFLNPCQYSYNNNFIKHTYYSRVNTF